MIIVSSVLLLLAVVSRVGCQRNPIPRSARASRNEAALEFECPEEFGYYPHPRDCTQYYVCVFGGALLESCTGGLMYSHELQTCDWPRNVGCPEGGSPIKEAEEDPLLERSAKIESLRSSNGPSNRSGSRSNSNNSRGASNRYRLSSARFRGNRSPRRPPRPPWRRSPKSRSVRGNRRGPTITRTSTSRPPRWRATGSNESTGGNPRRSARFKGTGMV